MAKYNTIVYICILFTHASVEATQGWFYSGFNLSQNSNSGDLCLLDI